MDKPMDDSYEKGLNNVAGSLLQLLPAGIIATCQTYFKLMFPFLHPKNIRTLDVFLCFQNIKNLEAFL